MLESGWEHKADNRDIIFKKWFEILTNKISWIGNEIENLRKENELQQEIILRIYQILYLIEKEKIIDEPKMNLAQLKDWVRSNINKNIQ